MSASPITIAPAIRIRRSLAAPLDGHELQSMRQQVAWRQPVHGGLRHAEVLQLRRRVPQDPVDVMVEGADELQQMQVTLQPIHGAE